jgi:hypothetical protein
MIRVSATTLESYRLFIEQDWMDESELLATIRGEFVPDRKVLLGQAFDAVLTHPDRYRVSAGYQVGRDFFSDDTMVPALALFDRRGVMQVKGTKTYGDVQVVAKADQLIGGTLIENKTTLSSFDADKYERSAQWRLMADLFEPLQITYHVFCLSDDDAGMIGLRSIETINFFPYAALTRDCQELIEKFHHYVQMRGLVPLLEQRYRDASLVNA